MDRFKQIIVFLSLLSYCYCELSNKKKNKLMNGFIDFYNKLPNQIYTCDEGYLQNVQQIAGQNSFAIEITLKVTENHKLDSTRYLRCTGKVIDLEEDGVSVLNHHCEETSFDENPSLTRGMPGGETEQDPKDPKYKALAEESMQKYLQSIGDTNPYKVVGINKVITQVVAGLLTTIDFTISPAVQATGDFTSCRSKILEQPWLYKKEITVYCGIFKSRSKREVTHESYTGRKLLNFGGGQTNQDVNNENPSLTRGMPGGETKQDPKDPKYKALAEESMQKYLQSIGDTNPYKVVGINKVITQVVAGLLTTIDFTISPAVQATGDFTSCRSKILEQPWLYKKEIKVYCGIFKSRSKREVTHESYTGRKLLNFGGGQTNQDVNNENPSLTQGMPGGETKQDPKDPKYKALAEESMQKYLQSIGDTNPYKVVGINKVITQVVAGLLTTIDFTISPAVQATGDFTSCRSKILEQPWLYKKEITVYCGIFKSRSKREVTHESYTGRKLLNFGGGQTNQDVNNENPSLTRGMPGGETEQDPKDPKYKALAEESMQKYLQSIGDTNPYKVVGINKVITQVVAGLLTTIDFTISPAVQATGDFTSCRSKILEQPWLYKKEITVYCGIFKSRSKREVTHESYTGRKLLNFGGGQTNQDVNNENPSLTRGMPGGETKQDPKDPKYKALAEESMQKYLQSIGDTNPYKVVGINKVITQVVAGLLTTIDFTISPAVQATGDFTSCRSKILEQPWLYKKEITVYCGIFKSRSKREVTHESYTGRELLNFGGGQTNQDVNNENPSLTRGMPVGETKQDPKDPKYKALAEESMHKYLQSIGDTNPYKVVGINKVITQVVAGLLTTIDFTISPAVQATGDFTSCRSKILEQPWLYKKEITVYCGIFKSRSKREVTHESYTGRKLLNFGGGQTNQDVNNENPSLTRGMPGGETKQDPKDPKYKALAEESMQKYLQSIGDTNPYKVVGINKVITQVVAGLLTTIDFTISPAVQATGDFTSCRSKILEQPWLYKKEITVYCGIFKSRSKREVTHESYTGRKLLNFGGGQTNQDVNNENPSLTRGMPGGETKQDPKDPKYKALAEESMQKYLQSIGDTNPYKVVGINKVITQVVAGLLTTIDFTISRAVQATGDFTSCRSKILEQPWLYKKEITVYCGIFKTRSKREVTHESYTGRKLLNFGGGQTNQDVNNENPSLTRGMPGGETEQDPNDPKYKTQGNYSQV